MAVVAAPANLNDAQEVEILIPSTNSDDNKKHKLYQLENTTAYADEQIENVFNRLTDASPMKRGFGENILLNVPTSFFYLKLMCLSSSLQHTILNAIIFAVKSEYFDIFFNDNQCSSTAQEFAVTKEHTSSQEKQEEKREEKQEEKLDQEKQEEKLDQGKQEEKFVQGEEEEKNFDQETEDNADKICEDYVIC
ncbi:unnamed protein product [Rotaria sp. Silwood2]|nr:unnamed protein product [Rotaria sp. Silwood2]CAF3158691.1 unnamed protein product [Rotaria sp. Silwood2]CAF4003920.1 unnamed protein product [Rotaria sp. Silwood2]CAF4158533.1 unnamed protein product [Rotaria sp. Silwood2]CAF4164180.1 unnamed protein product [Rotaria sp. Silwood2]